MKRSEASAKLVGYLMDYKKDTNAEFNSKDLADFVLLCMDRIGMLPPTLLEKSFYIEENGEMIYACNEWEKEK